MRAQQAPVICFSRINGRCSPHITRAARTSGTGDLEARRRLAAAADGCLPAAEHFVTKETPPIATPL